MKQMKMYPLVNRENCYEGKGFRVSILTQRLLRIEFQKENTFVNEATQRIINRNFVNTPFEVKETEVELIINTKFLKFVYDKTKNDIAGVKIHVLDVDGSELSVWKYGEEEGNLKGTARTLDEADGEVELENGLMSKSGYSIVDDSNSVLLVDDFVKERKQVMKDIYFFGYGTDYLACLKDFYHLCGKVPMIPRYMLGNWWSRFYKYTEQTYSELLDNFEKEEIPISVAVIDMDWHLTEVDPKYGGGWTGFTWNPEYFPNPKRFLYRLHERGLHTTLNIHPADGIRAFEEMYPMVAKAMGVNPETEEAIEFDMTNPEFVDAYFKYVMHPYEEMGVDFWWIDWQQGEETKIKNLDPLWLLNHFHYLDNAKNNNRPVIFSRYAGIGSHRYPIGFSGDTYATWDSLDFQPYFTANATNVGYGWWSHDICGHMHGRKSDDMMMRWLQFGVFSPIMRLHSSGNLFFVKEPWNLPIQCREIMKQYMQLRHKLIPYIYTMNYRAYKKGEPLIQPIYYKYPEVGKAYCHKNQYYFGTEIMVRPITTPMNPLLQQSSTEVFLPEGVYYDFFTHQRYQGNQTVTMFRGMETIPVLLRAGAILPLAKLEEGQSIDNPKGFDIYLYEGDCGSFELYEDDGESMAYESDVCVKTQLDYEEGEVVKFIRKEAKGTLELIPEKRDYSLHFVGYNHAEEIKVTLNEKEFPFEFTMLEDEICVELKQVDVIQELEVCLCKPTKNDNQVEKRAFSLLEQANIFYDSKDQVMQMIRKALPFEPDWEKMKELKVEEDVILALKELF